MRVRKRVTLEPKLEEMAGEMSPDQCRELAAMLRRFVHQLEVKAKVLAGDAQPKRKMEISRPPIRVCALN